MEAGKATKFIKLLAKKLGSDDSYKDQIKKPKKFLREVVANLPEGKLKADIGDRLGFYAKKLKSCLSKHGEPDVQPQPPKSSSKRATFPYNLYNKKGNSVTSAVEDTELHDQIYGTLLWKRLEVDPVETLGDLLATHNGGHKCTVLLNVTCGVTSHLGLLKVMHLYFISIQSDVEKCLAVLTKKKKRKKEKGTTESEEHETEQATRCQELCNKMKNFLSVCHLRHSIVQKHEDQEYMYSYGDLMSSILALYIDLYLVNNRWSDKKREQMARRLCNVCCYLTDGHSEYRLDTILQLTSVHYRDQDLLMPYVRRALERKPETGDKRHYLKYVLVVRTVCDLFRAKGSRGVSTDSVMDVLRLETIRSVSAPKKFLVWLWWMNEDILREMPVEDKKFKRGQITRFILEEAQDNTLSCLMDTLTQSEEDGGKEEAAPKSSTKKPSMTKLERKVFNKGKSEEPEDIFFIDKKGEENKKEEVGKTGRSTKRSQRKKWKEDSLEKAESQNQLQDNLFFVDKSGTTDSRKQETELSTKAESCEPPPDDIFFKKSQNQQEDNLFFVDRNGTKNSRAKETELSTKAESHEPPRDDIFNGTEEQEKEMTDLPTKKSKKKKRKKVSLEKEKTPKELQDDLFFIDKTGTKDSREKETKLPTKADHNGIKEQEKAVTELSTKADHNGIKEQEKAVTELPIKKSKKKKRKKKALKESESPKETEGNLFFIDTKGRKGSKKNDLEEKESSDDSLVITEVTMAEEDMEEEEIDDERDRILLEEDESDEEVTLVINEDLSENGDNMDTGKENEGPDVIPDSKADTEISSAAIEDKETQEMMSCFVNKSPKEAEEKSDNIEAIHIVDDSTDSEEVVLTLEELNVTPNVKSDVTLDVPVSGKSKRRQRPRSHHRPIEGIVALSSESSDVEIISPVLKQIHTTTPTMVNSQGDCEILTPKATEKQPSVTSPRNASPEKQPSLTSPRNASPEKESSVTSPINASPEKRPSLTSPRNASPEKQPPLTSPRNASPEKQVSITTPRNASPEKRPSVTSPRNASPEKQPSLTSPRNASPEKQVSITTPRNTSPGKQPSVTSPRNASPAKRPPLTSPRNASPEKRPSLTSPRNASPEKRPSVTSPRNASPEKQPSLTSPRNTSPEKQVSITTPRNTSPEKRASRMRQTRTSAEENKQETLLSTPLSWQQHRTPRITPRVKTEERQSNQGDDVFDFHSDSDDIPTSTKKRSVSEHEENVNLRHKQVTNVAFLDDVVEIKTPSKKSRTESTRTPKTTENEEAKTEATVLSRTSGDVKDMPSSKSRIESRKTPKMADKKPRKPETPVSSRKVDDVKEEENCSRKGRFQSLRTPKTIEKKAGIIETPKSSRKLDEIGETETPTRKSRADTVRTPKTVEKKKVKIETPVLSRKSDDEDEPETPKRKSRSESVRTPKTAERKKVKTETPVLSRKSDDEDEPETPKRKSRSESVRTPKTAERKKVKTETPVSSRQLRYRSVPTHTSTKKLPALSSINLGDQSRKMGNINSEVVPNSRDSSDNECTTEMLPSLNVHLKDSDDDISAFLTERKKSSSNVKESDRKSSGKSGSSGSPNKNSAKSKRTSLSTPKGKFTELKHPEPHYSPIITPLSTPKRQKLLPQSKLLNVGTLQSVSEDSRHDEMSGTASMPDKTSPRSSAVTPNVVGSYSLRNRKSTSGQIPSQSDSEIPISPGSDGDDRRQGRKRSLRSVDEDRVVSEQEFTDTEITFPQLKQRKTSRRKSESAVLAHQSPASPQRSQSKRKNKGSFLRREKN